MRTATVKWHCFFWSALWTLQSCEWSALYLWARSSRTDLKGKCNLRRCSRLSFLGCLLTKLYSVPYGRKTLICDGEFSVLIASNTAFNQKHTEQLQGRIITVSGLYLNPLKCDTPTCVSNFNFSPGKQQICLVKEISYSRFKQALCHLNPSYLALPKNSWSLSLYLFRWYAGVWWHCNSLNLARGAITKHLWMSLCGIHLEGNCIGMLN